MNSPRLIQRLYEVPSQPASMLVAAALTDTWYTMANRREVDTDALPAGPVMVSEMFRP